MTGGRAVTAVAAGVVLLGGSAAVAVAVAAPSLRVVVTWYPAAVLAAGAALLAGTLLLVATLRARAVRTRDRAQDAAHAAGREAERAAHRRFLARLDHELKNPVTALQAAAAGLEPDPDDGPRVRAHATVRGQSARLAALVADLRRLAELEVRDIEQELVDVAEVVRDAVADVVDQQTARGLARPDVVVTLPTAPWPLPPVRGDVDLLYAAVTNLLVNALKFSPPGARVEVRGSDEDGTVVVEVADTGPGIPADEVDLVFDELARGRDARGLPGSGLGLPLVRVVAERHGGRAVLRSRPGSGTSVRLHLPAAAG